MATVWIPPLMRSLSDGQERIEVDGQNVREIVAALEERFPGISERLLEEGRLRPGLSVAVDGTVSNKGIRESVQPDSEVHFVPAMSGG